MKRIGTIVLALAIICCSIGFFGYGGNVMATVTKGGQFEQIDYSNREFKLEAEEIS
ncbi:MAG: hypothetical protein R2883_06925 [Caldisericia bacterium]